MKHEHCFFTTFSEAKESQHYDHLFQKSFGLATASGVDVAIVRELGLHIENEDGSFPLDQYIADNNITVEFPEAYTLAKNHWKGTKAWASLNKYRDGFVYRKDHSDRVYMIIEISDLSELTLLDDEGNEVKVREEVMAGEE